MDELLIALRAAVALGAVLGLLWWISRRVQKGQTPGARSGGALSKRIGALFAPRPPSGARRDPERITVVARSSLGGRTQLVVAEFGGIRYVLGVSEHGVSVVDTQEAPGEESEPEPGPVRRASRVETVPVGDPSPFDGHAVPIFPDRATSRRQVRQRDGYRTPPLSR
ncbi:flagellar biosynthetic protein FliO [uncultured Microbacterium sp.]|uniref:FliO/MopB family protein n=1 Tax=uncultured Microbacterium sp. TaxID=191216 RepID=UPI0025D76A6D|nr:flagellar biosynthetic protein FliO [uncultured Microbacterium sp.]